MSRTASSAARHAADAARANSRPLPASYLQRSQLPLACLLFLLPFIVLYEAGTRRFAFDPARQTEQRIIAFTLMQDFFNLFGATGKYMPPLAVVGILLSVHIARNDPWKAKPSTLCGMGIEGAAWGLPLLALGTLSARYMSHYLPLMPAGEADWRTLFVLSLGAGIYEEMVFRLVALTILHMLLIDLLRLPRKSAYLSMVLISSLAFAFYHYLGSEQFGWRSLVFRTTAGVYFAGLFLARGFGVTAFSHACYDIYVVTLRYLVLV
jgi:membrane protease YdiL (CAAX protease family)